MKSLPEYIVTDPVGLRTCCDDVAASPHVGFDTEFVGEDTYVPHLCLIQVATANALYVLDPFDCGPLDEFWQLIADPSRLVVVHAGREEVRICQGAIGRPPANLFDLQIAAGLVGLGYPLGYGPLVGSVLKKRLSKGETLTDWRRRPLSQEQIRYAFDDVRDLLALWKRIDEKLTALGRSGWAKEEFAAFIGRALRDGGEAERWRKSEGRQQSRRQTAGDGSRSVSLARGRCCPPQSAGSVDASRRPHRRDRPAQSENRRLTLRRSGAWVAAT